MTTQAGNSGAAAVGSRAPAQTSADVTARSGEATLIGLHARWFDSCDHAVPIINLLEPPQSGEFDTTLGDRTLGPDDAGNCEGVSIKQVEVYYQSEPGFVGTDTVVYRRTTPDRPDDRLNTTRTVRITVAN